MTYVNIYIDLTKITCIYKQNYYLRKISTVKRKIEREVLAAPPFCLTKLNN